MDGGVVTVFNIVTSSNSPYRSGVLRLQKVRHPGSTKLARHLDRIGNGTYSLNK